MKATRAIAFVCLLATTCGGGGGTVIPPEAPAWAAGETFMPAPDAFIPKDPERLAHMLAKTTWALRQSVEHWREEGDPSRGKAPRALRLQALYQQRIYRFIARHHDTADATVEALPKWVAQEARWNLAAGRKLFSLVHPVSKHRRFTVGPPEPADRLRAYYREAQQRFHVGWGVLAAVNYVESKFGRVKSNSSAGAQGPMQFIPSTWEAYGMGGDVHDPHDAILGAANYLHASGAPGNYRNALYNYNHAWAYVDAVLLYAKQIARDARDYYEYYNWQVFIVTTNGDKRLTGPGLK